jgi:hypothetical protein
MMTSQDTGGWSIHDATMPETACCKRPTSDIEYFHQAARWSGSRTFGEKEYRV